MFSDVGIFYEDYLLGHLFLYTAQTSTFDTYENLEAAKPKYVNWLSNYSWYQHAFLICT